MNEALIASSLALVTAISWGFSDFFAAKASKTVGSTTTGFYVSVLGLIFYTPVYLLFLEPSGSLWSTGAAFAAIGGAVVVLAMYLFFKGLVYGPVSAVTPITASYPLFTTLLVIMAFNASLTPLQIGAIGIVVAGVMATSGLFEIKKSERKIGRGPLLGIVSAVVYGVGFGLVAQGVERIGWQTASLAQLLAAAIFFVPVALLLQGDERVFKNVRKGVRNKFIIGNALIGLLGMVILNVAFVYDKTSGAVVSAISACYPLLTIVLALRHFREEIRFIPLAGAAASVAGIILLSIS